MKKKIGGLFSAAIFVAASTQTHAQGFMYDQQSATNGVPLYANYVDGLNIQEDSPLMQSFIPTLSAIGFVQFEFWDIPSNGNNGATVYVNLWTGSTLTNTATFLGSTTPVYMPEGFQNPGLGGGGITNFYFSTLLTLTPGQTYYLQPVVLSGDDPWDIITIGDTYPNGQLYGKTGGYFQPSTDFWFREGVINVPEPSTLAVIGLSGILAYALRQRSKLFIVFATGTLLLGSTYAQTLSVQSAPDSIVQITADEAGLQPVSASALPRTGTFWVMMAGPNGNLTKLPYPALPPSLSSLPIYSVTANTFLVDATGGQLMAPSGPRMNSAMVASTVTMQAATVANLIATIQDNSLWPGGTNSGAGFYSDSFNYHPPTNGLWLEVLGHDSTNLWLRLHGTIEDDHYQLLSATNLLNTNWDLGEILFDAEDDYTDFSPVPITNAAAFFWAHHADPVMALWNTQDSIEPNPTNNDPGQTGIVRVYNVVPPATNDTTVYYTVSGGTAQSGIDYSNLPGALTIPAGQQSADIDIQPIADGLKPDQTIILTLVQNTNYLVDPPYLSATNTLYANPGVVPIANGDNVNVCPNSSKTFYLQAQDPRNLPLSYSIATWPTHGTLNTNGIPSVTYTPTNCYEGQDSFAFTASDGEFTSAPATVTLIISSQIYANPVSRQTCRGTPVGFGLDSGDYCGENLSYGLLTTPAHGTVDTNDMPYITYTPTGADFTGTDSFNYQVTDECGYSATATVSITVGDTGITSSDQGVMTGTNRPVNITLTANSSLGCTNAFDYIIVSGPTNGILSGSSANRVYTPNPNYEGLDSFQFTASDGVWTSPNSATITIYVVAGPILTAGCNPFRTGPSIELDWSLDNPVQQMEQQYHFISDYKIYHSLVSGGPYTCIYTNTDISRTSYTDTNAVAGQTNYYVATFEFAGNGMTYESPRSDGIVATGQNPDDLIAPDAIWDVTDISPNHPPIWMGDLQTPFSNLYPGQYPGLYPWPNTNWPAMTTWSNHIVLVIPTNVVDLSQVKYSIAIDNDYWLYLNNSTNYIDMTNHEFNAVWPPFKTLAPGILHRGTNDVGVVIRDRGAITYFSMVVTTNTCGH